MASGAFINPQTALLLTPLVSSTATLLFAHDQTLFLSILTQPSLSHRHPSSNSSNAHIPAYWAHFFGPGLRRVLGFLAVTTGSVAGCLYSHRPLLRAQGSLSWYVGAAGCALAHLLFTPLVAPRIQRMLDNEGGDVDVKQDVEFDVEAQKGVVEGKKSNVAILEEWVRLNTIRTWTTDLAAWVCAFVAVSKTLRA